MRYPAELKIPYRTKRINYDTAQVAFTCGACHILAYEMLKLLPKYYKVACLEDHCFVVNWDESECYDINGASHVEELMERWASDWEEGFMTFTIDELDEFVEIANDMYMDQIIPNAKYDSLMDDAKYWAKKMVEAMECGAVNELYEKSLDAKYFSTTVDFETILKKHLTKCNSMVC